MARKSNTDEAAESMTITPQDVAALAINTASRSEAPATETMGVLQFSEVVHRTAPEDPLLPALTQLDSLLWSASNLIKNNPGLTESGPCSEFLKRVGSALCP